ncbi:hypothetical protein HP532_22480, partial [Pseudomonas sp. CrR25]|nr:hypothetical protein [Pseudomonas sp. CrR25]
APVIAGHYLANLLCRQTPTGAGRLLADDRQRLSEGGRLPVVVRRGRRAVGGYVQELLFRFKRLWALVKGLLGGGDHHLAAASPYTSVGRRANWVPRHHDRGRG